MRRLLFVLVFVAVLFVPTAASATVWQRPVGGVVVRPFDPPKVKYGPGHLGADLRAIPGTQVRAAGPGTVTFAGTVAYAKHVVILHAGGLRTSYSFLAAIRVHQGDHINMGDVVGTTGGRNDDHDGSVLHFGLRAGDQYVDPMQLFTGVDLAATVHLAPAGGPIPDEAEPIAATILPPADYPMLCTAEWCKTAPGSDVGAR